MRYRDRPRVLSSARRSGVLLTSRAESTSFGIGPHRCDGATFWSIPAAEGWRVEWIEPAQLEPRLPIGSTSSPRSRVSGPAEAVLVDAPAFLAATRPRVESSGSASTAEHRFTIPCVKPWRAAWMTKPRRVATGAQGPGQGARGQPLGRTSQHLRLHLLAVGCRAAAPPRHQSAMANRPLSPSASTMWALSSMGLAGRG